jgi:hypothetical protein
MVWSGANGFLAPNLDLPEPNEDPKLFWEVMNQRERSTADVVNIKENATYITAEQQTAQNWFAASGNPISVTRGGFRMVINFGALPNAATKSVPHNIPITSQYSATLVLGAATNPTATGTNPIWIPVPRVDATDPVALSVTSTNVVITTVTNLSAFTICYIVLEYLKS